MEINKDQIQRVIAERNNELQLIQMRTRNIDEKRKKEIFLAVDVALERYKKALDMLAYE